MPEFKECFNLFDGDSDGMVTEKELALIMRSLGENITHFEIAELMRKAGKCREFKQHEEERWGAPVKFVKICACDLPL